MARNMKSALSKSVKDERSAVEARFKKADTVMEGGGGLVEATATRPAKPREEPALKKTKVIRDSFTMPEDDYRLIGELKTRCLKMGVETNKGEVVRAGLKVLADMSDKEFRQAIGAVEKVKTGRPKIQ